MKGAERNSRVWERDSWVEGQSVRWGLRGEFPLIVTGLIQPVAKGGGADDIKGDRGIWYCPSCRKQTILTARDVRTACSWGDQLHPKVLSVPNANNSDFKGGW